MHPVALPKDAKRLLIEATVSRPKLHALLVYAYLISRAQKMRPVFVVEGAARCLLEEIVPSYFKDFEIVAPSVVGFTNKVYFLFLAIIFWVQVFCGRDLVKLRWQGLQIGDIVYDQYLAQRQFSRLHRGDIQLVRFIYITLRSIADSEKHLKVSGASAVLLSHRVGLTTAPMANAAQAIGLPIYSFGGDRFGTLLKAPVRKCYEYTATQEELQSILGLPDTAQELLFEAIHRELLRGEFNADSKLAFSRKLFQDRREFANAFILPHERRNVFIMLHAFTDYPHSHFDGMLFADFHDWFMKTLNHAYKNTSVNWIVKAHPASSFYPVKDMNWQKIQSKYKAAHIAFMSESADFDTRSICHVGDAVITCIGSAGFELSAMSGIPTITAGDNPYSGNGFAVFPKSRKEYFQVLRNIVNLERLQGEQLRRARATFSFIHRLSRVTMSSIPSLSHLEQRTYVVDDDYFSLVAKQLEGNEDSFREELQNYSAEIEREDFRALRTSPSAYLESINEYAAS